MREPSGEGESCWLSGTLRLVGFLPKSCLPFVSSRFSILNPEALCLALCTVGLSLSAGAQGPTFTTFDPPGAISTQANSINPAGAITGTYSDASFAGHGLLRTRDGTITTIDPPGAINVTQANSINPAGAIMGFYFDGSGVHGFLRRAH